MRAYEKLFDRYVPRLYHFARGYLGSSDLSEELVQDVFLKIWEKRGEIKATESFKSYLFTIAFNLIRKYFNKKVREQRYIQQFAVEFLFDTEDAGEKIRYEQLLQKVDQLIERMPERRREIFILSRKEGLSIAEIAARLDVAPKTVKNQLTDATNFLRAEFGSYGATAALLLALFYPVFSE